MSKISQYANSVAALGTDDLFDVSEKISSSPDVYESRKMTGAVLATFIQSYTSNILNTNSLTLGGNYTHDLAGNQLVFDGGNLGVVGEIGVTADDVSRTNVFVAGDYLGQSILSVKNAGNVGVGTLTPDASAVLDASSTDSGFLVPRMTTAQKTAISTPAESLIVYDTDLNRHEYYNSAGSWAALDSDTNFANTDLTFTTDRTHQLGTNIFKIAGSGGNDFTFNKTGIGRILLDGDSAGLELGDDYIPSRLQWSKTGFNGGTNTSTILSTNYESDANLYYMAWNGKSNGSHYFTVNNATGDYLSNNQKFAIDVNGVYSYNNNGLIVYPSSSTKPSLSSSAALEVVSTTQGFLPPRMTTTQKNAITHPATGLTVFDTTLAKLCVYTGAAWETVTSA